MPSANPGPRTIGQGRGREHEPPAELPASVRILAAQVVWELDIGYCPEPEPLEQPHPRAAEQLCDDGFNPGHRREQCPHFVSGQHHRQARLAASFGVIRDVPEFRAEHVAVQKQQRTKRLGLCGWGDVVGHGQMVEKPPHSIRTEFARMSTTVVNHVFAVPVDVQVLRSKAVVACADLPAKEVFESGRGGCGVHCRNVTFNRSRPVPKSARTG